jgi:hypothetical protein
MFSFHLIAKFGEIGLSPRLHHKIEKTLVPKFGSGSVQRRVVSQTWLCPMITVRHPSGLWFSLERSSTFGGARRTSVEESSDVRLSQRRPRTALHRRCDDELICVLGDGKCEGLIRLF